MLNWLRGKKSADALPTYSKLKGLPSANLPDEAEVVAARWEEIEKELLEIVRRHAEDAPMFSLVLIAQQQVLMAGDPEGGQCLLTFGSPFRAADYVRTLFSGMHPQFGGSSPSQLLGLLGKLRELGVDRFTIDRCPRCPPSTAFTQIGSSGMQAPDDLIKVWATGEAIQMARLELYVERAREWAHAGRLEAARDLALVSVGHVHFEDPRPHLLLGQLAVVLGDRRLLQEARTFLNYFGFATWERRLDEVERAGGCDFSTDEWTRRPARHG